MSTWMIVEDEPDLYDMLLLMTEALAHEGVAFLNGEEAISWIDDMDTSRITQSRPEFALIDVRLPGDIQGDEVAHQLRASNMLRNIPIILMTAYRLSPDEEREMMGYSGANLLIYKPLPNPQELQALFRELSETALQHAETAQASAGKSAARGSLRRRKRA